MRYKGIALGVRKDSDNPSVWVRAVSNLPWIHMNAVDHGSIRIEVMGI